MSEEEKRHCKSFSGWPYGGSIKAETTGSQLPGGKGCFRQHLKSWIEGRSRKLRAGGQERSPPGDEKGQRGIGLVERRAGPRLARWREDSKT